jgi:hypothetical protein
MPADINRPVTSLNLYGWVRFRLKKEKKRIAKVELGLGLLRA